MGLAGPSVVFFLNAASFLGTVLVLALWRPGRIHKLKQGVLAAFRSGIVYVVRAGHLRGPLARVGVLCFFSSFAIALLPIIARDRMHLGAAEYGVLLGAFGFGALMGGASVPFVRQFLPPGAIVGWGTALAACGLAGLACAPSLVTGMMALPAYGFAWISSMVNLNVAVQTSVPSDLRGRAMAFYITVFQGSFAMGSLTSGFAAKAVGVGGALLVAATMLLIWVPISLKLPIPMSTSAQDLSNVDDEV